jgi:hypothetical protein
MHTGNAGTDAITGDILLFHHYNGFTVSALDSKWPASSCRAAGRQLEGRN